MAETSNQTNTPFPWLDLLPVVVLSGAGLLSNTLANQFPFPSAAPAVPIFLGSLVAVVLLESLRMLLRSARRKWQRRLRGIVQTVLIPGGAVAGLLSNYAANALQVPPGLSASEWHGLVLGTFLGLVALLMILAPVTEWRRARARLTNPDRRRFLQLLDSAYFAYVKDPLQGSVRAALGVQALPTVVRQLERGESPLHTVGDPRADTVVQTATTDQHENTRHDTHNRDELPIITLPPGGTLRGLYDTNGGQMLILGEPGAGKSTQLQALGRELVRQALADGHLSMPVILDVSTWAEDPDTQLEQWLAKAIKKTYGVLEKTAATWVKEQHIALLLDALDVMAENDRAPCVQAINAYHARHPQNPLVVCCRKEEYEELRTHLKLRNAVMLLPLTDAAIKEELLRGGERQATLLDVVSRDERLRDALRTPLILNLVMFTYSSLPADGIPPVDDVEAWRRELFRHYIDLMLRDAHGYAPGHRPGIREVAVSHTVETFQQTLMWLGYELAEHNENTFYLEQLQADWLPDETARQVDRRLWRRLWVALVLVSGLVVGLVAWLVSGLVFWLVGGLVIGMSGGLSVWLVVVWLEGRSESGERITPVKVTWSDRAFRDALLSGLLFGLLMGLFMRLVSGLLFGLPLGLVIGLVMGLVLGLIEGLGSESVPELKLRRPNEGIRRLLLVGLFRGLAMGLIAGLVMGLIIGLVSGLVYGLISGLIVGLVMALVSGLATGGGDILRHYMLRRSLRLSGVMPKRPVRFLEEASELVLLRRVGGGYQFIHQLIRDYFAEQYVPPNQ